MLLSQYVSIYSKGVTGIWYLVLLYIVRNILARGSVGNIMRLDFIWNKDKLLFCSCYTKIIYWLLRRDFKIILYIYFFPEKMICIRRTFMTSHFWGHLLMTPKLQGYKLTSTRESNKQILSMHQIIKSSNKKFKGGLKTSYFVAQIINDNLVFIPELRMFHPYSLDKMTDVVLYILKFKITLYPTKLIACNIEDTLILIEHLYSTYAYHKI